MSMAKLRVCIENGFVNNFHLILFLVQPNKRYSIALGPRGPYFLMRRKQAKTHIGGNRFEWFPPKNPFPTRPKGKPFGIPTRNQDTVYKFHIVLCENKSPSLFCAGFPKGPERPLWSYVEGVVRGNPSKGFPRPALFPFSGRAEKGGRAA